MSAKQRQAMKKESGQREETPPPTPSITSAETHMEPPPLVLIATGAASSSSTPDCITTPSASNLSISPGQLSNSSDTATTTVSVQMGMPREHTASRPEASTTPVSMSAVAMKAEPKSIVTSPVPTVSVLNKSASFIPVPTVPVSIPSVLTNPSTAVTEPPIRYDNNSQHAEPTNVLTEAPYTEKPPSETTAIRELRQELTRMQLQHRIWKLQNALMQEFCRDADKYTVYSILASRTILPTESVQEYVINMRALAYQGEVTETELLRFVVKGIGSRVESSALYGARSLDDVRNIAGMYEQCREETVRPLQRAQGPAISPIPRAVVRPVGRSIPVTSQISSNRPPRAGFRLAASASTSGSMARLSPRSARPRDDFSEVRCFNCRQFGHVSANCLSARRPLDGCFFCFEPGHQYRSCPNRRRSEEVVAVLDHEDSEQDTPSVSEVAALQPSRQLYPTSSSATLHDHYSTEPSVSRN